MARADGPHELVHFHCARSVGGCGHRFAAEPGGVVDAAALEHHPFEYTAECPACGREAPQAAWERALAKAWTKATGPTTADGKAASARNLAGHPSAEESYRTRFNAMKHGLFARTATYFPAKPGRYPQCDGCDLFDACHEQIACLKRTELFLKTHIAFESRDPSMLMEVHAGNQAAIQSLINDMIIAIAADGGPRLRSPEWYYDKDGGFHLARYRNSQGGSLVDDDEFNTGVIDEWVQIYKPRAASFAQAPNRFHREKFHDVVRHGNDAEGSGRAGHDAGLPGSENYRQRGRARISGATNHGARRHAGSDRALSGKSRSRPGSDRTWRG